MNIETTVNGIVISEIINGRLFKKIYSGYTKAAAIVLFNRQKPVEIDYKGKHYVITFENSGVYEFAFASCTFMEKIELGPKLHRWTRNKRTLKQALKRAM